MGLTVKVDDILAKYCEKSEYKHYKEYLKITNDLGVDNDIKEKANKYAEDKTLRELEQGLQGLEYKLNTVASSRGDYPFVSFAFGDNFSKWGILITRSALKVRKVGQGAPGKKKPMIFPKLIMLYREEWYGKNAPYEYVFDEAIDCSSKAQYPDYFSLEPSSYAGKIYEKYKEPIIVMGCVHRDETITYKLEGEILINTFEEFWAKMSSLFGEKEQSENNGYYIDLENIDILDSSTGEFVKCTRTNKNRTKEEDKWLRISFSNGLRLTCTEDHPLPVQGRGRLYAGDINIKDFVRMSTARADSEYMPDKDTFISKAKGKTFYFTNDLSEAKKILVWSINNGIHAIITAGGTCNYCVVTNPQKQIGDLAQVTVIEQVQPERFSYDVTTESDHFDVSGVSSHNCRSHTTPWFKQGGLEPSGPDDVPVLLGRANLGVQTVNLHMIYKKAQVEGLDFYNVLDYYLEMIRQIHLKTYEYLGSFKASCNPLAYCFGGFYGGNLKPDDKIKPVVDLMTASFGYGGLSELQEMYNGKKINEDSAFVLDVLKHINDKIEEFKHKDNKMYSLYGTPGEVLLTKQVQQYKAKYGDDPIITSKPWLTNSFHVPVTEHVDPIEKQDIERKFWDLSNGGKIQYVRYPDPKNTEAIKATVRHAMTLGYYEGVNIAQCFCEDCGARFNDANKCPTCNSLNITKIDRICGLTNGPLC